MKMLNAGEFPGVDFLGKILEKPGEGWQLPPLIARPRVNQSILKLRHKLSKSNSKPYKLVTQPQNSA